MISVVFAIILSVFLLSWFLTGSVRKLSLAHNMLDVPNQRSSHSVATPSGGGAAIVAAWLAGLILLSLGERIGNSFLLAVIPPSVLLALTGFLDDRFDLSPWLRLLAQASSAAWFVLISGSDFAIGVAAIDDSHVLSSGLAILGLVWLINLYNFMDGIDGIAATEAIFVALAMSAFYWFMNVGDIATISVMLAAACAGFLLLNWPPARIFMGDTGASWVGFILGALAMSGSERSGSSIWPYVIILGVFIVDATVTLLRRLMSGQKWYEAHRSHAYQILSRRWGAHRPVTIVVFLINTCWLLPFAAAAAYLPQYSGLFVVVAFAPLAVVAWRLGAGCTEKARVPRPRPD